MASVCLKWLFPDFRIWLISLSRAVSVFLTSAVYICACELSSILFSFSFLSSSTGLCNFPQRQLGLLDFFHLSSTTRFAEHYSKMTSKKQGKYILYVKKEPKTKKHRCSNISCWIFLILFFAPLFIFLLLTKHFWVRTSVLCSGFMLEEFHFIFNIHKHRFSIVACFIHSISAGMKRFVFLWRTRKLF